MAGAEVYARQVFINCPFSEDYRPLFEAIVFAVTACGFRPRCALAADDGGEVRVEKVAALSAPAASAFTTSLLWNWTRAVVLPA